MSLTIAKSLNDLNDDILFTIFKYFPLKQRVAMARVCRRWAQILNRIWKTHRCLQFGFFPGKPETLKISQSDICYKRSFSISILRLLSFNWKRKKEFKKWPKVAYKCENLKILDLAGTAWDDQKVYVTGHELATHCPMIEHFVLTKDELYLLVDYVKHRSASNCIRAMEINYGWRDGDEDYDNPYPHYDVRMMTLLAHCPKLESLYACSVSPRVLLKFVPQLRELRLSSCNPRDIEIIESRGQRLVKLLLPSITLSTYQIRELVSQIPGLRSISFRSAISNMKYLKGLKNLQEVIWTQSHEEDDTDFTRSRMKDAFESFCSSSGRKLRGLTLYVWYKIKPEFFRCLDQCPALTHLKLNLKGSRKVGIEKFPLQKMVNLRVLYVSWLPLTNEDVIQLLNCCPKLRELYFDYCESLTIDLMDRFIDYANKHPRKHFIVNVTERRKSGKHSVRKTMGRAKISFEFEDPYEAFEYDSGDIAFI